MIPIGLLHKLFTSILHFSKSVNYTVECRNLNFQKIPFQYLAQASPIIGSHPLLSVHVWLFICFSLIKLPSPDALLTSKTLYFYKEWPGLKKSRSFHEFLRNVKHHRFYELMKIADSSDIFNDFREILSKFILQCLNSCSQ